MWLAEHPFCAECGREGMIRAGTVVDHIIPHKGNRELFNDSEHNWQTLCTPHHNTKTADETFRPAKNG